MAAWPLQWANESLLLARQELGSLQPGKAIVHTSGGKEANGIDIKLPDSYKASAVVTDEKQIWDAGSRLADVLTTIWP